MLRKLFFRGSSSINHSKPFREAFSRLKELRSICRENLPVLALTATANTDISSLIKEFVNLSANTKVVCASVDRPNIRLTVVKIRSKTFDCLLWMINEIKSKGITCPKIIIYCRTITLVGWMFDKLSTNLGKYAYINQDSENPAKRLIGIFHSESSKNRKEKVMSSLTETGLIRVVVATSSLGCGINCKDVEYVVHFGSSFALADYCQQVGRAGRGSVQQAHAILYHYPQGGKKVIKEDIISYIHTADRRCLRVSLYSQFSNNSSKISPILPKHNCCCFCSKSCTCECCPVYIYESNEDPYESKVPLPNFSRIVSQADKDFLFQLLEEYRARLYVSQNHLFAPVSSVCGIDSKIASEIIENAPFISCLDDIYNRSKVFGDIDDHDKLDGAAASEIAPCLQSIELGGHDNLALNDSILSIDGEISADDFSDIEPLC